MARTCTICTHVKLLAIDRHILRGDTLNAVAHRFRVSPDALSRHRHHMTTAMVRASKKAPNPEAYGRTLLGELNAIKTDIERLQADAEQRRDVRSALCAIRERVALLEFEARLCGQIDTGRKNEVHLHFPAERALAIAEAYVARHGPAKPIPEIAMLPAKNDTEEIQ